MVLTAEPNHEEDFSRLWAGKSLQKRLEIYRKRRDALPRALAAEDSKIMQIMQKEVDAAKAYDKKKGGEPPLRTYLQAGRLLTINKHLEAKNMAIQAVLWFGRKLIETHSAELKPQQLTDLKRFTQEIIADSRDISSKLSSNSNLVNRFLLRTEEGLQRLREARGRRNAQDARNQPGRKRKAPEWPNVVKFQRRI